MQLKTKVINSVLGVTVATGVTLGAPTIDRDMIWYHSYDSLCFDNIDCELKLDEYSMDDDGNYIIRTDTKDRQSPFVTRNEDDIIGKTFVPVDTGRRAYYNEFFDAEGKVKRFVSDKTKYESLAKVKDYPQPAKVERISLLGSLLNPIETQAAIAYDADTDGGLVSIGCSDSWSHTTASDTDMGMVLHSFGEDTTAADEALDSATYNSVALGSQRVDVNNSITTEIWDLENPSTGSNTVAVTWCSSGSCSGCAAGVTTFSGVNQTDMNDAENGGSFVNDATPSVSVTTATDNAWVTAVAATTQSTVGADLNGDLTERFDIGGTNDQGVAQDTNAAVTPAGAQAMSWTCTGLSCSGIDGTMTGMAIAPAAAAVPDPYQAIIVK